MRKLTKRILLRKAEDGLGTLLARQVFGYGHVNQVNQAAKRIGPKVEVGTISALECRRGLEYRQGNLLHIVAPASGITRRGGVPCTPDHNHGVRSLFHSSSSSQVASLGERKDAIDKRDAKKFGRVLSGGITTKNTLPSSHIQALMLQASGYEPVLTTLSKQELCKEAGLQLRDLRAVDPLFRHQLPVLLIRSSSYVVRLEVDEEEQLKAVIKSDRVLLFSQEKDPSSQDSGAPKFLPELQRKIASAKLATDGPSTPFEFVALYAMLDYVCPRLHTRFHKLERQILNQLEKMRQAEQESHSWQSFRNTNESLVVAETLVKLKNNLDNLYHDIDELSGAIWDVLKSDEDLAGMYLSERQRGEVRDVKDHEEAEILLEGYVQYLDELTNDIKVLHGNINNTERYVSMALGAKRNMLIRIDILLNMATTSLTCGGIIAAIFGMNLESGLENSPHLFSIVCVAVPGLSVVVFFMLVKVVRWRMLTSTATRR